jgi:hypothetical protein
MRATRQRRLLAATLVIAVHTGAAAQATGIQRLARIEGPRPGQPGQTRRTEYPYRRVACTAD